MYTFKLPIGDWSGDGHNKCNYYLVKSNKPVNEVRDIHFKIKTTIGIDIEDICADYNDNSVNISMINTLKTIGYEFPDHMIEDDDCDFVTLYPDAMVDLWIFLLMKVDNSLNLEIINDDVDMLSFYGFDDEGRHIGFVGYGCFN